MQKVIITLTTIPNRLNTHEGGLKPVIDKILNLSYPNYEIHLNLPYICKKSGEEYIIPSWLGEINNDKLKVFRTEDYGSLTKILPTLMRLDRNDETILITIDDDLEYIDGFIEYHLEKGKDYPNCALGFAGLSAIDGSCHYCTSLANDTRVKILEGYKTVSYKNNFFKEDFFEEFVGKSWSDDIIISAYLGKHNIKKIVINYDKDDDYTPRVESFPIVGHLPNERGGCFWFRNENINDNADIWYKLGYLER
jgi:hypothetical protein